MRPHRRHILQETFNTTKKTKNMADITMCEGKDCPLKETCFRFTAEHNEFYQAYFIIVPFKDGKCEHYWKRREK